MWNKLFPNALPVYSYDGFLQAVADYPMFCGETIKGSTDIVNGCKVDLATILAHITHETWFLTAVEELACNTTFKRQGEDCDYSADSAFYPPVSDQQYFGRGAFQISWNYNYG